MSAKITKKTQYNNQPTLFSDGVNIACRMDGGLLLAFISETPDMYIENFRTVMTKEDIIEFLDNLALATDHYPVKESPKQLEKKKVKRPIPVPE